MGDPNKTEWSPLQIAIRAKVPLPKLPPRDLTKNNKDATNVWTKPLPQTIRSIRQQAPVLPLIPKIVMSKKLLPPPAIQHQHKYSNGPTTCDTGIDINDIPEFLDDVDFCLTWAIEINLTMRKAETIINSFNMIRTTRDRLSRISHSIIRSFFLWFLHKKFPKYLQDAIKEINIAGDLLNEWEKETNRNVKIITYNGFVEEYIDGVDYVITAMKCLIEPYDQDIDTDILYTRPTGSVLAGVLHVKQEFFRPFFDEIDLRLTILYKIRKLNPRDSRACLYLAKTLGQIRKMENFISAPSHQELDLLAEGHMKAKGDHSIIIELCFCLAQFLRNSKKLVKEFPLMLYKNTMSFKDDNAVAKFIIQQTTEVWNEAPDAAPLYVKLAEIHSSLLPDRFRHPSITPLALVNRALEKYTKYSKALHRKAKILFKLKRHEEGLKCLEASFACGETNCDALCDLIFRLMRYSNREKLDPIFQKYCSDYGENLWGKRKVGTLYYLCGCYLWMLNLRKVAVWHWLKAEKMNPNPTFYFQKLYTQKTNYKWHNANLLGFPDIIRFLKSLEANFDKEARDSLVAKLRSISEQ